MFRAEGVPNTSVNKLTLTSNQVAASRLSLDLFHIPVHARIKPMTVSSTTVLLSVLQLSQLQIDISRFQTYQLAA